MSALTAEQERFAELVARGTGLELPTVRAWVLSEGGPSDNPLNIMQWASGARSIRRYGSPDAAATATVQLLRDPRYANVLDAAHGTDPRAELQAIAVSPWEENQYRGASSTVGALLFGAYARLTGAGGGDANAAAADGAAQTIGFDPKTFLPGPLGPLFGLFDGWLPDLNPLDDQWFAKGFLHVAFTVLAVMLIFVGLNRSLGGAPGHVAGVVARTAATRGRVPATDDIPF